MPQGILVAQGYLCFFDTLVPYAGAHTISSMAVTARKFVAWVLNHSPDNKKPSDRGWQEAVSGQTGLDQSYISKMVSGKHAGKVRLDTLERIAQAKSCEVWEIVREIEKESDPAPSRVTPLDETIRREWEELFDRNPKRGRQVLMNLRHQERLQYTESISAMVRAIIEIGPRDAWKMVSDELQALGSRDKTRAVTRRKLADEYREIG